VTLTEGFPVIGKSKPFLNLITSECPS